MINSQALHNPWQAPSNKEGIEAALKEIFAGHERVIFDFGRAYSGDLFSETFLESQLEDAKWLLQLIDRISQQNGGTSIEARFSDGKTLDLFKKSSSMSWSLWENGTTLSFYDFKTLEKSSKVISLFDLLSLIQEGRLCNEALTNGNNQLILPICLWGDVEQIGFHFVDYDQTFAEVFEFVGNAGPRPLVTFVNGPLGHAYSWPELKGLKLRDVQMPIRTLHFFKEKQVEGLLKVWNEYFREDSCHKCLPCGYSRHGMKEDKNVQTLRGVAAFQCHYPSLYRKVDSFLKNLEDPPSRSVGGNG